VELHLDDTDLTEAVAAAWAAEFHEAVRAWFSACGATVMPKVYRLSELLKSIQEPELSGRLWRLTCDLYSPTTSTFDSLVATKAIDADINNLTVSKSPASRLLRPVYTWLSLEAALDRHGLMDHTDAPVVTLGGQDERKMWDLWRSRTAVPSVASVYVPRLEPPAEGADLWKYHELARDTPYRERDLARFVRQALADSDGSSLLYWFYTVAVELANKASRGTITRPSVGGRELSSWFSVQTALQDDPVGTSSAMAHAVSVWFHADDLELP
jgi:hypothetical protein